MKPHIICHMLASLDGSLHPSRYTESPDVTMAEMSKAGAHPPAHVGKVERPHHFARRDAGSYAVALDASGKLHFAKPDIGGDHVVVLLGRDVEDSHLAELAADGVSYVVSQTPDIDLAAMLDVLGRELGISRLLLEGGAGINGSFFAAGLVDELSLLIAPALDARAANQGVVEFGEAGLAGKMRLSLTSCEVLAHGLVHLRYAVSAG
ncbi:MAG: RibD family protein [Mesorhizobium sp.]|nr:MAG: RibD family protein [Mesorhizobium sp.]